MMKNLHAFSETNEENVCNVCHGMARLCKLGTCPLYRDLFRETLAEKHSGRQLSGPSPPTFLVGEKGYPRVALGSALVYADDINPALLESPSKWLDFSVNELLRLRLSLLLGLTITHVKTPINRRDLLTTLQESAASVKPVDFEITTAGSVKTLPGFSIRTAPYGPSARVEKVKLMGNVSIPRKVDSYLNDPYVKAEETLTSLYKAGHDEYYLTRLFSAGLLGTARQRKLVPTEWSITAVDDILSKQLYKQVRQYSIINEYRVTSYSAVENAATVVLTPTAWMYELLEGWLRYMDKPPYSDHEILKPRKTYAENTGGAYYAVRFSLLRHLADRREQCGAIVFFEIKPGWVPLGVWRFREIVKKALEQRTERFQSLDEALAHIEPHLSIPLHVYLKQSSLIPLLRKQQKIDIQ